MANDELKGRVYIKEIKEVFNLKQVTGDEESLTRYIIAPDINRPGLELTGYTESDELKRVVVIGNKENEYLCKLDYEVQKERFEYLTDVYTPCIIISSGNCAMDSLVEVAEKKNFPVFEYNGKTYQLIADLVTYLAEELAPKDEIHGVMMNVYGVGVMIRGKSGIGKSELALDLIKRGHRLISDDSVEVYHVSNHIICKAPKLLRKMLEIRGLGVIDIDKIFGPTAYVKKSNLDFVIELIKLEDSLEIDRLDPLRKTETILGLEIPKLVIPVSESKSLSSIIETSVSDYILKLNGIDTNERFKESVRNEIIKKEEK